MNLDNGLRVITTHVNADFDGLASCFAAKKLGIGDEVVFPGNFNQNVEDFLRIYADFLPAKTFHEIDVDRIAELVIVDTSSRKRIGKFGGLLSRKDIKISVYDHHPLLREEDIVTDNYHRNETGANVTAFVEEIKRRHLKISSVEATLFALGIYEDTGSLVYPTTTCRDVDAVSYLLSIGADLNIISEYLKIELTFEQKTLLNSLFLNTKVHSVLSYTVAISRAEIPKYMGGLNMIVNNLWKLTSYDTYIAIVKMGKRIYVVGRTATSDIDLGGVFEKFGGGGHQKAASYFIKDGTKVDLEFVERQILEGIKMGGIKPAIKVKDIMSSPVRVALNDMTIEEAYTLMYKTGYNGLPIVEHNKLVGIISKAEVEKALNHGYGNRTVKGFMSQNFETVAPDMPLSDVKEKLISSTLGRLPVMENDMLVGIVTRTDLLRGLHTSLKLPPGSHKMYEEPRMLKHSVLGLMMKLISPRILNLLRILGYVGNDANMPVFVVGGFVRDLLMGKPSVDIDIVVEGDALRFARAMKLYFEHICVYEHKKFRTAVVSFPDGFKMDIATARTEYYDRPAKLPNVEISTIKKDLYRRDFTINAMAVKLNPIEFGVLLDFFNCKKDLDNKLIRTLYTLSFVEDPTRILRAIRFKVKFAFEIEARTLDLLRNSTDEGIIEKLSGARIRDEMVKIMQEEKAPEAIRESSRLKILKWILPYTYFNDEMFEELTGVREFSIFLKKKGIKLNMHFAYLNVLMQYYTKEQLLSVSQRYGLSKRFVKSLLNLRSVSNKVITGISRENLKNSELYELLSDLPNESIAFIYAKIKEIGKDNVKKYYDTGYGAKVKIDGNFLKSLGISPGPMYREILRSLILAKIDGKVKDEKEYVKILVDSIKEKEQKTNV